MDTIKPLHEKEEAIKPSEAYKIESLTLESAQAEELIAEIVERILGKSISQTRQLEFPCGESVEGLVQFNPTIIRRDLLTGTVSCFGWDTHSNEGHSLYQVRFNSERVEGVPVTFEITSSFNHCNPAMIPTLF